MIEWRKGRREGESLEKGEGDGEKGREWGENEQTKERAKKRRAEMGKSCEESEKGGKERKVKVERVSRKKSEKVDTGDGRKL